MHPANCLNCEKALSPGFRFCPQCGQNAATHRLNVAHLSHELLHFFTHADKGILFLIKSLLVRPGIVAGEYIGGKRIKYFSPLNFYLIVAGLVLFFTTTFKSEKLSGRVRSMQQAAAGMPDGRAKQSLLLTSHRLQNVEVVTGKYSNFIAMLATPLLVIFLWLMYKKGPYNYTEHLVANLYFTGITNAVYAVIFLPLGYLQPGGGFLLLVPFFVFEIAYRSLAYIQLMNATTAGARLKAILACLFVIVFWAAAVSFLIQNYIRSGLWGLFP